MRRGSTHKNESKLKISKSKVGNRNCVGRKLSEESKSLMSKKRIEYIANNPDWNKKQLQAIRAKSISKELKQQNSLIRTRLKNFIRRLTRLKCYRKNGRTHEVIGYNFSEFKTHIESQFFGEMSWDKRESFHIDHRVPISAFIKNGNIDPQIINALHNLQPMLPKENRAKSDTYDMKNFGVDVFDIMCDVNIRNINKGLEPVYEFA